MLLHNSYSLPEHSSGRWRIPITEAVLLLEYDGRFAFRTSHSLALVISGSLPGIVAYVDNLSINDR